MSNQQQMERDEYDQPFTLKKRIGDGGQGEVWMTETHSYVIKRALHQETRDSPKTLVSKEEIPEVFSYYQKKYDLMRRLPIPQNIHVALPAALLKDHAGYVMRLMDEMIPLNDLRVGDKDAFNQSGGLKRRLELLCRIASVFSELHGAGLVYGDISPNNVFVTADKDFDQPNAWLIDADNLALADLDPQKGFGIYTPGKGGPGYGAPEVYNGTAKCSLESDVYSLLLMAYDLLAMNHPFRGEGQSEDSNSEEGWSASNTANPQDDPDAMANSGKLPWVGDRQDQSNQSSDGLPPEHVLNDELYWLFDRAFTPGRLAPAKRPSIFLLPPAFGRAADLIITCPHCGWSWYAADDTEKCKLCKKNTGPRVRIEQNGRLLYAKELRFSAKESLPLILPERVFLPFHTKSHGLPAFELKIRKGSPLKLELKRGRIEGADWQLTRGASRDEQKETFYSDITLEVKPKEEISFSLHHQGKSWTVKLEGLNETE